MHFFRESRLAPGHPIPARPPPPQIFVSIPIPYFAPNPFDRRPIPPDPAVILIVYFSPPLPDHPANMNITALHIDFPNVLCIMYWNGSRVGRIIIY